MIIDSHTHLASPVALPGVFFDGWAENVRRLLPPDVPVAHQTRIEDTFRLGRLDPDGDQLVAEMDAAGIDVSVSLIIDYGLAFPGHVPPLEAVFAAHRALLERHRGRFVVFAGVDPRRGRSGLELFERSLVEWGFKGLKLYPPCGFSPSDAALDPFYDLCAQHRVPVVTHTGPTSPKLSFRNTHPADVEDAARRFPGVDFILAHGAIVHRDDAALLAEYRPNVYLDTAGFQAVHRRGEWSDTLAFFKRRGLIRKLLFGTDWPIHCQYGAQKTWVGRLAGASDQTVAGPLSESEAKWIREDNACEILKVEPVTRTS
ncbi:MAG TPA: amidohydrolase family protein [Polyangiaceae bacterium]